MRVLLDTSAYSAFMRGNEDVAEVLQVAETICLNAIVLGELLAGFARGGNKARNERLLARFCESARVHVVPVDEETSARYAVILNSLWKSGTPIASNDLWIASTAMQHGLTVLTTDTDFLKVSQVMVRHFQVEGS